jgi:hypothetical protein
MFQRCPNHLPTMIDWMDISQMASITGKSKSMTLGLCMMWLVGNVA